MDEGDKTIEKITQLLKGEGAKVNPEEVGEAKERAEKDIKKEEGKFLKEEDVIPQE